MYPNLTCPLDYASLEEFLNEKPLTRIQNNRTLVALSQPFIVASFTEVSYSCFVTEISCNFCHAHFTLYCVGMTVMHMVINSQQGRVYSTHKEKCSPAREHSQTVYCMWPLANKQIQFRIALSIIHSQTGLCLHIAPPFAWPPIQLSWKA